MGTKGNMYIEERGAQDRHQSESDDDGGNRAFVMLQLMIMMAAVDDEVVEGKILLLLFYYSRQAARRECNAKAPEGEDDDGEVVGVDDDEGEVGKLFWWDKKRRDRIQANSARKSKEK